MSFRPRRVAFTCLWGQLLSSDRRQRLKLSATIVRLQATEEKNVIILWAIVTGVAVGILSGLVGIAGGAVLVPILYYGFKMNQHMAQGTTLAVLLPPTGLLAFLKYHKAGNADLTIGLLIALGLFFGGYFGGAWAQKIPDVVLRRIFAVMLAATAIKMFFEK
jgi:uncharacterized protein